MISDFVFFGNGRLEYSLNVQAPARYRPQLVPFEADMARMLVKRGATDANEAAAAARRARRGSSSPASALADPLDPKVALHERRPGAREGGAAQADRPRRRVDEPLDGDGRAR